MLWLPSYLCIPFTALPIPVSIPAAGPYDIARSHLNLFSLSRSSFLWLTFPFFSPCSFFSHCRILCSHWIETCSLVKQISLKDCRGFFFYYFTSKLFEFLWSGSTGRERKKHKQVWTEVSRRVNVICYCNLFMIEGVLSWAPKSPSQKKRGGWCCHQENQEITIKFFCCLVEVFRMCFLYIFIRP